MIILSPLFEESTPEINPQVCQSDVDKFFNNTKGNIYWSPKLDGVRTWAIVNRNNSVRYFSRNGKELFNFYPFSDHLIDLAKKTKLKYPVIFDCEVASESKSVREVMTQLRRLSNIDPSKLELHIFDIVISGKPFSERINILNKAFRGKKYSNVFQLRYEKSDHTLEQLNNIKIQMISKGYEGIMLHDGSAFYHFGKRSNKCCKMKEVNTLDLPIVDVVIAPSGHRWEGKLLKIVADYRGQRIPMSGKLSLKDREYYAKYPPIGKYAEVDFQEITPRGVLRHPRFIRLREDK